MPVTRVFDGISIATSLCAQYRERLFTWSDIQEYLPFLHETARSYDKVRVLELGARTGNSTVAFLAAAEQVNGHVISVDIDKVTDYREMRPLAGCPLWTFVQGSDISQDVQAQLPPEVDVLFVDTSHEYDHTLSELRIYMPRVIPGGIALFHDTNLAGWGGNPPREDSPEVWQALDAYCLEAGLSWQNQTGVYGLGVIRL